MTRNALPTGKGTSKTNDVADPHPSDEEHYTEQEHPGGARPPKRTEKEVAVHRHKGKPERK